MVLLSAPVRLSVKTILLGFVLLCFLAGYAQYAEAARKPSAKRECATCHIMWLTDFKRADVKTLIPYDPTPQTEVGKTEVASTQRICFSCHDGFVLDSRFMWKQGGHAHPVGVKPSDKVHIPLVEGKELFPLNDDGKMYCGSCHTAHGVDWDQSKTAVFMRVSNENGQLCLACHEEKGDGPEKGRHPVFEKLDKIPQRLMEAGARFGADKEVLCQSCHRPHGAAGEKMLLLNNDSSQLCGTCHTDQYQPDREAAGHGGTHPVNLRPERARIPETFKQQGAKFGKTGELICQTCHVTHEAAAGTPILVMENKDSALCQSCHKAQKTVADSQHDMRLVDAANKNVRKDAVGEAGVCSACHLAHKGTGPKMWARPPGDGDDAMAGLCLSCHRNRGLASKAQVGRHSHPVGVINAGAGQGVDLPTFSPAGVRQSDGRKGLVSCASCHNPHRWDPENARLRSRPGTKGNASNRFLRKTNDGESSLCRTCHRRQAQVRTSKHNLKLTAPDERNSRNQALRESGICGACHLVHNAVGPFIWARKLKPGSGSRASAICTDCHSDGGLAEDKGIGRHSHPVNVDIKLLGIKVSEGLWRSDVARPATQSALQPLPLYDKRGEHTRGSGQVECGSCHDPHVWSAVRGRKPVKDIAGTEGGADNSFLRIADKGKSALCVNCHVNKQAVAQSKHNLPLYLAQVEAKEGKSRKAALKGDKDVQTQEKSVSVCGTCHMPHNAKGIKLWARDTGPGKNAIEVLCKDCHRRGGSAEKKLAGNYNHPIGVELKTAMAPEGLPTFAKDGQKLEHGGQLDCASCHDPHLWTAGDTVGGAVGDLTVDGDGHNSFLRLPAAPSSQLCVECHQDQRWVFKTDHDLSITAPYARNRHGQTVAESGVCGQCHTPHSGIDSPLLWARYWDDEATNPAEKRCRSCHRDAEIADKKQPAASRHPDKVRVWSKALRATLRGAQTPDMPVYSKAGNPAVVGAITCATCHNPHQWDPSRESVGPGSNIEGDLKTSFLRNRRTGLFTCADCHGVDSLFRYKYFHSKSTHRK